MISVNERPDAKVLVVIPSSGLARYVWFEMSAQGVFVPQGSDLYRTMSGSPAKGRNEAVRQAQDDITHFFFIDDDQWFNQDVIMTLLNHRVPIVCATVSLRYPPFAPLVFKGENSTPQGKTLTSYSWADLKGRKGLIPVYAAAGSGLLVERQVFKKLPEPWFVVGKFAPEDLSEDMYFYELARKAGFPIYVDLATTLGHLSPTAVWPMQTEQGEWYISVMWENQEQIRLAVDTKPAEGKKA